MVSVDLDNSTIDELILILYRSCDQIEITIVYKFTCQTINLEMASVLVIVLWVILPLLSETFEIMGNRASAHRSRVHMSKESVILEGPEAIFDKIRRPSHVGISRKRMNLDFAVMLMRTSYSTADDLDFVPMVLMSSTSFTLPFGSNESCMIRMNFKRVSFCFVKVSGKITKGTIQQFFKEIWRIPYTSISFRSANML